MMNQNYDDTRTKVLIENTAQGVFKHLNEMKLSGRHTRWIWELLQNARDVATDADNHLITAVKYSGEELVFLHNGRGFTVDEIAHLIFYGSTKVEDERTIGQYGSGFLTTHLLSWEIDVSGQLEDGNWFNFRLARRPESVKVLQDSMDQSWEAFKSSIKESRPESLPDSFTTQFVYPIKEQEAEQAVEAGIETLKQCAPYVVISNPQFSRINIDFTGEKICFEAKRPESDPPGVQQITVTEDTNGNSKDRQYLLAKGDTETSVTVPLELKEGGLVCQSVEKIPRLFLGFPLVGTEAFSFPAVINSFKFTPTENRNGVYLGKSDDSENNTNQAIIEEACVLLARLLQHSASAAWHHTHQWIEIPAIQGNDWVDAEWMKNCVRNKLMAAIYNKTPVVLNETGNAILMKEAVLPVAESNEGVKALWDLLEVWKEYPEKLPRRVETTGWCKTIKNWANILGDAPSEFRATIDGSQLASQMVEKTKNSQGWGNLTNLQELLRADVSDVEWLNQFYGFLRDHEFDHVIHALRFIPDQEGWFHSLSQLHRDPGIDDVLKEVAELLEWRIRLDLRDLRLPSLDQEDGPGYMKNDEVVTKLLAHLSDRATENPDDAFKEASVNLFNWIVRQENYSNLSNFPVFAADNKSILELPSAHKSTPPLAPVRSWDTDLQPFADLFPPERILDDAFFQKVSDQEVWKHLDDLGIVRTNMIISREVTNLKGLSLELEGSNESHEAAAPLSVIDFVERETIMAQVRNSTERGRLFWRFLTEYLIKVGHQSLETQMIKCKSCGKSHNCYQAAWLEGVRNNQWIRQGHSRFAPDAKSLANLLRGSDWKLSTMDENHALVEFLKAIRLTPSELRLEFLMNDEERETVIRKVTEVHQAVQGNWGPIEAVAKRIQNDEKASENIVRILEASEDELDQVAEELAERQKQQRRVIENQDLGQQVEKWVGDNLKDEGFEVKPVHTGADFIIESDLITLGVTQGAREWWIEVKSARTESVKMSSKQTQKALDKKENFLLCVVPIPENTDLNFETVRKNMRFIKNISKKFGDRVTELCEYIGGQEAVLTNDPDDTSPGVELEGEAGKAEMRIQKSVWESDEAFPLESLIEKLK